MAADKSRAIQYQQSKTTNEMNPNLDYFNAGGGVICFLAGILGENLLAVAGWVGTILSIIYTLMRIYDWVITKINKKKEQ